MKNQDGHLGRSSEEEKALPGERVASMGTQLFSMAISSRDPPEGREDIVSTESAVEDCLLP